MYITIYAHYRLCTQRSINIKVYVHEALSVAVRACMAVECGCVCVAEDVACLRRVCVSQGASVPHAEG